MRPFIRPPRAGVVRTILLLLMVASSGTAQQYEAFSASIAAAVGAHYEHLHQHAELGKQETVTSAYIMQVLKRSGYTNFTSVPGLPTAVIATYDTGRPGRTIGLRADIDARPQQEATGLAYASKTHGVMHSCGHDAHAAMLLGAAQALPQLATLRGKVVLIFQPAEETRGGADDIMTSGVLEKLGVEMIVAQHVVPGLPVGTIQLSPGAIMAGSNYFTITLNGAGSHAAAPHDGTDLPTCIAGLAADLPTLFTRRVDQLTNPALLSITYLNVGSEQASNVLPSTATIRGTIRAFADIDDVAGKTTLRTILTEYVNATATRCGATATITLREASPPTTNDPSLYAALLPKIAAAWPTPIGTQPRGMFSEDFAYYTATIPSLYFSQGISKANRGNEPVHTSTFTIHPDALQHGVRLLLTVATTN